MRAIASLLVLGAATLASVPAIACYKPSVPYCATDYGSFQDEHEFSTCRSEMESYQSDVESFVRCQKSEIETLQSDIETLQTEIEDLTRDAKRVIDEHSETVDSFNSRARQ